MGGLIQDHVVGAVKLTIRGRFFTEEDYHELVYFALGGYSKRIILEPPCMFKPMLLWSGKQVVSTIVKNLIPPSKLPLTFTSMAKIKSKVFPLETFFVTNCFLLRVALYKLVVIYRNGGSGNRALGRQEGLCQKTKCQNRWLFLDGENFFLGS